MEKESVVSVVLPHKRIALAIGGISIGLVLFLAYRMHSGGYALWNSPFDMATTGQFGDYIGGVVGTILSAGAFYMLIIGFIEQRKMIKLQEDQFHKSHFENNYFKLIDIHRQNVQEFKYTNYGKATETRKVFKAIYFDIRDCLLEIKRFDKHFPVQDFVSAEYKSFVSTILTRDGRTASISEALIIDIAYNIVYFGLDSEGISVLRSRLNKRYDNDFVLSLLYFFRSKPLAEDTKNNDEWTSWSYLRDEDDTVRFKKILEELPKLQNGTLKERDAYQQSFQLLANHSFNAFYGGHQIRLGHYFRHLFQTIKYLDSNSHLSKAEKKFLAKTLRSQLSTYEQVVFFINSVSDLGRAWELNSKEGRNLITEYELIKNVPEEFILKIDFKKYYPKINFEYEG